jgi:hypothetical protein
MAIVATVCASIPLNHGDSTELVVDPLHPSKGDFSLAVDHAISDIIISPEDFAVVRNAANGLSSDVERVTGKAPAVRTSPLNISQNALLVGKCQQPVMTRHRNIQDY